MNHLNSDTPLATRVLVVDDNKVNQMICKKYLEKMHIQVDIADNGKLAISKCRDNAYNMIIMDMEMPLLGGVEATRIIREKSLSFAPVIALTGNDNIQSRQKCKLAGMNGFITKPINREALEREVGKILK